MKRYALSLVVLMMGVFLWWEPTVLADGEYEIDRYQVNIDLHEDGSGSFEEAITYNFDGDFNGVFYNLDLNGIKAIENLSVSVKDQSGKESVPFKKNNSETTGSYQETQADGFLKLKVFQKANDEKKTVIYRYTIPEVVTNYQDTAEFNGRVIGSGWDDALNNVEIAIHLPKKAENDTLKAWAHGSLNGKVALENNQTVRLTLDQNPSNTFVEAHVIFPTTITPLNPNVKNEKKRDQILASEKELAEAANRKRQRVMWFAIVITLISFVVAILGAYSGRKAAKKDKFKGLHIPEHLYELPEDMTPAVMYSAIKNKDPRTIEITSTLMDLVRKKQLTLEEIPLDSTMKLLKKEPKTTYLITKIASAKSDALLPHESYLIKWLIDDIGDGAAVTLKEIENFGKKKRKQAQKFLDSYKKWQKQVRTVADQKDYISPRDSKAKSIVIGYNMLLFILLILGTITMTLLNGFYPWAMVIMLVLLLVSLLQWIHFFPIRTLKGETAVRQWSSFKAMLEDVSNLKMAEVGSLVLWDHFLVYAISLDVSEKVIEALAIQFPQEELDRMYIGHYYMYNSLWGASMQNSFNHSFENSFNNAMGNAISNSSSATGSGGGFSGGSSGGFGGGSGGGAF